MAGAESVQYFRVGQAKVQAHLYFFILVVLDNGERFWSGVEGRGRPQVCFLQNGGGRTPSIFIKNPTAYSW